jgi:hypothetical protein
VRELENVVERELIFHPHGPLTFAELHAPAFATAQSGNTTRDPVDFPDEILPVDTVMPSICNMSSITRMAALKGRVARQSY